MIKLRSYFIIISQLKGEAKVEQMKDISKLKKLESKNKCSLTAKPD